MKKYVVILFLLVIVVPSVAMAAWWNPRTWKVFQKRQSFPQAQLVTNETTRNSAEEIKNLQGQIDDLKKTTIFC